MLEDRALKRMETWVLGQTLGKWAAHRAVLALALPIIAANLTQPLLSTVDTAIAGHLPGAVALGGVALGGLFFNVVFWAFGFLRMSTTGLVAHAHGAGDPAALGGHFLRAMILALAIGGLLVAIKVPLAAGAIRLLGGSAEVRAAARTYVDLRLWSAPFALGNFVVLGYLLGRQRAAWAMLIQTLINFVNMGAAFFLAMGLHLGVAGLGAATALADLGGFVAGLVVMSRLWPTKGAMPDWRRIFADGAASRLLVVNADIFLRTLCLVACFAWFTHEGAKAGDAVLAANALLLNFQTIMAYLLDGFAQAAEALVGAAVGAGARVAYCQALRVPTLWAVLTALVFALAYALAGPAILALLSDDAQVRRTALVFLPWAVVSPLVSVWCFQLDGIFIGATRTRDMRDGMVLSMLCFMAAALALPPFFGNHGLWAALMLFMAARAVTLAWRLPRMGRELFPA